MQVTFTFLGKQYTGTLSKVMGAGSTSTYHLYVNKFYWGRLRYTTQYNKYVFDPVPKDEGKGLEELADYFAQHINSEAD